MPLIGWRPESGTYGAFRKLMVKTSALPITDITQVVTTERGQPLQGREEAQPPADVRVVCALLPYCCCSHTQVSAGVSTPRLSQALSRGQLSELAGARSEDERFLTLSLVAAGRALELEVVRGDGMSDAQALAYHHRVVAALQALVAAKDAWQQQQSPATSTTPRAAQR